MFDLVITSPPYGDSRTTVAYGEYSRLSLQWLGLGHLTEKEILGIDRSLMGGKNTGKALLPTSTAQRCKIRWNKFPSLIWSVPEMSIAFMKTSTHPSVPCRKRQKRAAISSGSSATAPWKKVLLQTDVIISELASLYHLQHVYTIDRNIPNKVMPSLNSPTNEAGAKVTTMTNEHIVVLRKI